MNNQLDRYILTLLLLAMLPSHDATAQLPSNLASQSQPLWAENLSPMAQLVALPSQRSAHIAQSWQWELHSAIASHWTVQGNGNTAVRFDGESTRAIAAFEWGFAPQWSARVSLPWINHGGGFLDGVINDWHRLFGMSDGGRQNFPQDQLAFLYNSDRNSQSLMANATGIGDVRTELSYQLSRSSTDAWSLSAGYKWATGDDDQWLGSGAGDVFATLRYSGRHRSDLPLTWHTQLGYTRAGKSTLLGPRQRRDLWYAGFAVDWRLAQRWSLLAQIDSHEGVMQSDTAALDEPTVMLTLGARFAITPRLSVEASFVEDIRVESAPDVTFQASFRWVPTDN